MREHKPSVPAMRIPMTTEEAIIGIEGVEGMSSINKVSSPGYPYALESDSGAHIIHYLFNVKSDSIISENQNNSTHFFVE